MTSSPPSPLFRQIGHRQIISGSNTRVSRPSMNLIIQILLFAILAFLLASASSMDGDDGLNGIDQKDIDNEPKSCVATYECWPTEPVLDNGRPLMMMPSIVKRLNIGGHHSSGRGVKCRCREGQCTFYSVPKRRFFNCQEF